MMRQKEMGCLRIPLTFYCGIPELLDQFLTDTDLVKTLPLVTIIIMELLFNPLYWLAVGIVGLLFIVVSNYYYL
jgi:hypothetical protein